MSLPSFGTYSFEIPLPDLGLNKRDSLRVMDPRYSPNLINFLPTQRGFLLRKGRTIYASGFAGKVVHMAELPLGDGTTKFVAWTGVTRHVYDISATTASPSTLDGSLTWTGDTWQSTVFRHVLFACNNGQIDGVKWTGTGNFATAFGAGAFTGYSGTEKARYVWSHRDRLYFLGDGATIWYGPVNGTSGALSSFDALSLLTLGGRLVMAGSLSSVRGSASQNYCALISDRGEVLIYAGAYPASTTWTLTGRYIVSPPIGIRSLFYFNGALHYVSQGGIVNIPQLMEQGGQFDLATDSISGELSGLFSGQSVSVPTIAEVSYSSKLNLLMMRIGDGTDATYARNSSPPAWAQFKWPTNSGPFATLNGSLYQADATGSVVYNNFSGYEDQVYIPSLVSTIQGAMDTGFVRPNPTIDISTALLAHVTTAMDSTISSNRSLITAEIDTDLYSVPDNPKSAVTRTLSGVGRNEFVVGGQGRSFSCSVKTSSSELGLVSIGSAIHNIELYAVELLCQKGGIV